MTFKQLVAQLEVMLQQRYKEKFYLDTARLAKCLQEKYQQNLNNITLPVVLIMNLVTNPISLRDYANIYSISYASIVKNKRLYTSLIEKKVTHRSHFTIAEFEAGHFQILENKRFGRLLERKIKADKELTLALNKNSLDTDETIADNIYKILRAQFNLPI